MENRLIPLHSEPAIPPAIKTVWGAWATTGFGLLVIGTSFIAQIITVIGFMIGYLATEPRFDISHFSETIVPIEGLVAAVATIVSAIICIPLIALFASLREGNSFASYVGLRRVSKKQLISWLAITLGIIVLSEAIKILLKIPSDEDQIHIYATSVWPPLLWISVIVFAPALEETLFRGFLFEGFRRSRIGTLLTIVLMSLVWTSLHVPSLFFDLATIFAGGLAMGIARVKTNSLWIPLSMHAFWNLIATIEIIAFA